MNFQEIKNKIESASKIDFGTVFSLSIDLFKKTWVQGLIMSLLMFAAVFVLEMVVFIPVGLLSAGSSMFSPEGLNDMSVGLIVAMVVAVILLLALIMTVSVSLTGGLYLIYKKADHNEEYSTNDFFALLKKDKIGKTFAIAMAQLGIGIVFYMMCFFPLLYAMIPISFITLIYAYNPNLSVSEIVKLSFGIGNKNWLETFLLRIVTGFLAMLGIFLCGVGLLVSMALVLIPQYFIYKQTIGFDEQNEINAIGTTEDSIWNS